MTKTFTYLFGLVLVSCGGQAPAANSASQPVVAASSKLADVLAGKQRTDQERARDVYRHPRETLEFFGVTEHSHVVELSAGKGWYTAILAPLVTPDGALTVTGADPNGPADSEGTKNAKELAERVHQDPATFGRVTSLVVDWKQPNVSLGPDASADVVLTFRNLHGWIRDGVLDNVLSACRRVLKSCAVLGIVEHRAKPGTAPDPQAIGETGYTPEAFVIQAVESHGFKLAAKSEVNANPKDTTDHPKGVWTLPPTLRLGDVDREKYLAIGESDRMTLKFIKQ